MRILGLISGTSHDGIDAAVVDFAIHEGGLDARVMAHDSYLYPAPLRRELVAALPPAPTTFEQMARLDTLIGQAFADAASSAIAEHGPVDLVSSHGQTVYHWVEGGAVRGTLQIGQPAWIAERTGTPVLSDIRIRDITAGGQGAPLASTLDVLLLAGRSSPSGALNLGGISNLTVLEDGHAHAWDIGPANALIDAVVTGRDLHPDGFDAGGQLAASGTVDEELLQILLAEPYYASPPPKTTGKELFHVAYVEAALGQHQREITDADLIATLTELTVRVVAADVARHGLIDLYISGGGVHNPVLMDGLVRSLPDVEIHDSAELGVGADEKEAVLLALLGWLSWHGAPGTVPTATGARAGRILGTLTPGAEPLRLPEPVAAPATMQIRTGE